MISALAPCAAMCAAMCASSAAIQAVVGGASVEERIQQARELLVESLRRGDAPAFFRLRPPGRSQDRVRELRVPWEERLALWRELGEHPVVSYQQRALARAPRLLGWRGEWTRLGWRARLHLVGEAWEYEHQIGLEWALDAPRPHLLELCCRLRAGEPRGSLERAPLDLEGASLETILRCGAPAPFSAEQLARCAALLGSEGPATGSGDLGIGALVADLLRALEAGDGQLMERVSRWTLRPSRGARLRRDWQRSLRRLGAMPDPATLLPRVAGLYARAVALRLFASGPEGRFDVELRRTAAGVRGGWKIESLWLRRGSFDLRFPQQFSRYIAAKSSSRPSQPASSATPGAGAGGGGAAERGGQ